MELNLNYIDKNVIKQRKKIYGDSFEEISRLQSEYLGIEITPSQVAKSLAILKEVRVNFIKTKLQKLRDIPNFSDYIIQVEIRDLTNGLEDSKKDMANYLWISENYKEYEAL